MHRSEVTLIQISDEGTDKIKNKSGKRTDPDLSKCGGDKWMISISTLRPRQNGRPFPDDTFKRIFLIENVWISIKNSLKFVHKCPIDNIPTLVQIMAWRRTDDKPLSQQMMVSLLTHICVTQPQWDKEKFERGFSVELRKIEIFTWGKRDNKSVFVVYYGVSNIFVLETP